MLIASATENLHLAIGDVRTSLISAFDGAMTFPDRNVVLSTTILDGKRIGALLLLYV